MTIKEKGKMEHSFICNMCNAVIEVEATDVLFDKKLLATDCTGEEIYIYEPYVLCPCCNHKHRLPYYGAFTHDEYSKALKEFKKKYGGDKNIPKTPETTVILKS